MMHEVQVRFSNIFTFVCLPTFEVRFSLSKNRNNRIPLVLSSCGRDISTLIDIYVNGAINTAVIDPTVDFYLISD